MGDRGSRRRITANSPRLMKTISIQGLIDDGAGDRSLHPEGWHTSDRVGSEVQFRSAWYFWWGIWWELLLRYLFLGFSDFALHQILGAVLQSRFWFPVVQFLVLQLEQILAVHVFRHVSDNGNLLLVVCRNSAGIVVCL